MKTLTLNEDTLFEVLINKKEIEVPLSVGYWIEKGSEIKLLEILLNSGSLSGGNCLVIASRVRKIGNRVFIGVELIEQDRSFI